MPSDAVINAPTIAGTSKMDFDEFMTHLFNALIRIVRWRKATHGPQRRRRGGLRRQQIEV